jgi:hypothetical protein
MPSQGGSMSGGSEAGSMHSNMSEDVRRPKKAKGRDRLVEAASALDNMHSIKPPKDRERFMADAAKNSQIRRLSTVTNLHDAMEQFDLDVGDEIPKADQIKMFIELNKSMNHTMANYVGCVRYDRAVDRADAARQGDEFAQIQLQGQGRPKSLRTS